MKKNLKQVQPSQKQLNYGFIVSGTSYKTSFKLSNKPNKEGLCQLMLDIRGKEYQYPNEDSTTPTLASVRKALATQIRLYPAEWVSATQSINPSAKTFRIEPKRLELVQKQYNHYLDILDSISEVINENGYFSLMIFVEHWERLLNPTKYEDERRGTIIPFAEITDELLINVKISTKRIIISNINILKEYCYLNQINYIEDVNSNFLINYKKFAEQKNKKPQTIRNNISYIKNFFKILFQKYPNFEVNLIMPKIKFLAKDKVKKFTLSKEQIKELIAYVPESKNEQIAKNLFLIQIYTGLRVNDTLKLSSNNILNEMGVFHLVVLTEKTNEIIKFQINEHCYNLINEIIRLPKIDYFYYVRGLKKLMQNIPFAQKKHISGVPIFEMITTHTGRSTCATLAYNNGVHIETIKQRLGHTNINQTYEYIRSCEGIIASEQQKMLDVFNF